jgi:hypothetical protein
MAAIGKGIGGAGLGIIGGVVGAVVEGSAAQGFGPSGEADEATVYRAAQANQGSLIMEPHQIEQIKDTFWTHAIWFDGGTYAIKGGFSSKELKREVGLWCQANNVKHAGLLPTK